MASGCFREAGSTQQQTSYTPEQKEWLTQAMGTYGPELGQGQESYPGARVAEFTPDQKAAMGGLGGFLDTFSAGRDMPMYGQTGQALEGILGGQTGAQKITPQQTQDYFQRSIQEPAQRQFSEYTRPLIREEYAGPGFWGSSRAGAVTKAGQEMGDWLGEQRGQLEWQAGETNRAIDEAKAGRALAGVPLGMQYGQMPTQEAGARLAGRQGVFGFAGAEQQMQQQKINVSMQKFQEGKNLTDEDNLNILMGLLGMSYSQGTGESWGASPGYEMMKSFGQSYGSSMGQGLGAMSGGAPVS